MGATTSGICGLVADGYVCRPAIGECDAPERCGGIALVCPADGPYPGWAIDAAVATKIDAGLKIDGMPVVDGSPDSMRAPVDGIAIRDASVPPMDGRTLDAGAPRDAERMTEASPDAMSRDASRVVDATLPRDATVVDGPSSPDARSGARTKGLYACTTVVGSSIHQTPAAIVLLSMAACLLRRRRLRCEQAGTRQSIAPE